MIGRDDPVVGTVNRTCNGIARDDEGSVMGVMDMVGVAALTEILLALLIRACSASGDDVDCIMVDFRDVMWGRCFGTSAAKVFCNRGLDERGSIEPIEETVSYTSLINLAAVFMYPLSSSSYMYLSHIRTN